VRGFARQLPDPKKGTLANKRRMEVKECPRFSYHAGRGHDRRPRAPILRVLVGYRDDDIWRFDLKLASAGQDPSPPFA
jgi:hypothetical protein